MSDLQGVFLIIAGAYLCTKLLLLYAWYIASKRLERTALYKQQKVRELLGHCARTR